MTKEQLAEHFAMSIEKERLHLKLTQAQMAKTLEISLSSYKNMINGVSTNIPVYVAYKMYQLTGKLFFELCEEAIPELDFLIRYRNLPAHMKKMIQTMIFTESELACAHPELNASSKNDYTSLYIPTGNMQDGMIFDTVNVKTINIKKYKQMFGNQIDCAIKITSNHLHPVYHINDILLICQQPPRDGDTGIFIHKPSQHIYIRRFRQTNPCRLEPLSEHGRVITVDNFDDQDMEQWIKFGYVLTKMR